ncbi:ParB/RepB/Spo0J family partition protein [Phaeobacter sp. A90a-4k]|uniref:ParB/RepB/Spo0J family partition protein n=1 Tax=unclassified Phaeobacter TaxID=2621772 RepID=UPI003A884C40
MTRQDQINATVEQVPFGDLYISDLNPRTVIDPAGIEALAANIRDLGLIQNLAGLREEVGTRVGIVAGGRRYRALALLQDDPRFASVPVRIAPDRATAELWAASENHQREQPHAADEIREYGRMSSRGVAVPAIAMAFGVSEAHVYRRLKLAGLPAPVLDALKAGEISLQSAAAFTVSEDEAHMLTVLDQVRGANYSDHHIRQLLKPDAVRQTDRRAVFVGLDAYQAEGGRITRDLFAEQTYLDDVAQLDRLFTLKLHTTAEAMEGAGWKWVEATDATYIGYHQIEAEKLGRIYREEGVLSEEDSARYEELLELAEGDVLDETGEAELAALQVVLDGHWSDEQKAVAGVLICVSQSGEVQAVEGLVRKEDRLAAIEAGFLRPSQHASADNTTPKSPISQALRDDLSRIVTGARQHAMLRDPDLLIDLLAYQLSHALHWNKPLGIDTSEVPNWPTTEAEGYAPDPRLTENAPRDMYGKDLGKSFRAFRAKGAEHVRGELTRFLAAHYRGGDEKLKALIDKETAPGFREVWTPTAANFFSRVGGPYLNALWCELLDLAEDHPTATAFAKLKKGEKAAKLEALFADEETRKALRVTEEQTARIAAWLPEGMA